MRFIKWVLAVLLLSLSGYVSALEIGAGLVGCKVGGVLEFCGNDRPAQHVFLVAPVYEDGGFTLAFELHHLSQLDETDRYMLSDPQIGTGWINWGGLYLRYKF